MTNRVWLVALGLVELAACAGDATRSPAPEQGEDGGASERPEAGAAWGGANDTESRNDAGNAPDAGGAGGQRATGAGEGDAGDGQNAAGGRPENESGGQGSNLGGASAGGALNSGSGGDGAEEPCFGDGQIVCRGTCVDPATDNAHCGSCTNACSAAAACHEGECVCEGDAIHCAGACIDASSDVKNCGRCGAPCSLDETCAAGECSKSAGGEPGSDGCEGLAHGVTLRSVSAYQSIEIPLMMDGTEVAPSARRAPVLTRKATLFRLSFSLEDDFTARPLAGRVFVENDGTVDAYSEKKIVRSSSKTFALDSTFQILVPREKIQESTRYRVELVECAGDGEDGAGPGGASGGGSSPRYPGEGGAELGARAGGTLKVTLVPLRANGLLPDTSARALALYEDAALAVYPASSVELSVGRALEVDNARDWNGMLDAVRARRRADAPSHDVYYYGMLKPRATLAEYCGTTEDCTTGLGFLVPDGRTRAQASIRASVGLAYANLESAMTMLHELGHNHGRDHAPCNVDPSDADPGFPYPSGSIGGYGWDHRRGVLIRPRAHDLMSYCLPPWISDYTYNGILDRMTALSSPASAHEIVAENALGPWRVLLLDELGARWGIPIPERTPASGAPESALALDRFGRVLEAVQVYRAALADSRAASIQVPEPKPAWFSVQVAGAPALAFSSNP